MERQITIYLVITLAVGSFGAAKEPSSTASFANLDLDSISYSDLSDYRLGSDSILAPIAANNKRRERRDLSPPNDDNLEKIAAAKNAREARLLGSPPENWSKQPLAVQFRARTGSVNPTPLDRYDDEADDDTDEQSNLSPLIRAHHAPRTDFVTSGRGGRGPATEGREPREMPIARSSSYDEYDVPIFRNFVREHEYDVQLPPRNYYYPNRYRAQRDYYYRGPPNAPPPNPSAYHHHHHHHPYDHRYRDQDDDYDLYNSNTNNNYNNNNRYNNAGRSTTPKPKRIIYYATLPEIVRKPVDLRNPIVNNNNNYPRPYEPMMMRASLEPLQAEQLDRMKQTMPSNNIEPLNRWSSHPPPPPPSNVQQQRYPYDGPYDNYVKRSSYYYNDRRRPAPYVTGNDDRLKDDEQKKLRSAGVVADDRNIDDGQSLTRNSDRRSGVAPSSWPSQIGAEINVKENDRTTGRKIYGQIDNNYDRYDGARIKKDNNERKDDGGFGVQDGDAGNGSGDRNNVGNSGSKGSNDNGNSKRK